ncbi:MAG TPA: response regulator [Myxococcales bacterium]|jgi:DNA-binding NtrC family response regulator|nr:response regulator [Myxococcales bacterium]
MSEHTILVVDDEPSIRSALERTLRRENYRVITASSGEEGLALLKANPIDVAISDHLMPQMTGLEFLKLVRDRHQDVGRIILTGHADTEVAIKAINEGEIYRFLRKPWDDIELKVIVHLALEQVVLARENRQLLATVRQQGEYIRDLETLHPGISRVRRDDEGAIVLDEDEMRLLAL